MHNDSHISSVRPDAKGRITLGALAKGVSSFKIVPQENGALLLEPYAEIPAREKWLFENKEALAQVQQGLKEAREGELHDLGDFSHYIDD